jgi:hypothetical protein
LLPSKVKNLGAQRGGIFWNFLDFFRISFSEWCLGIRSVSEVNFWQFKKNQKHGAHCCTLAKMCPFQKKLFFYFFLFKNSTFRSV